MPQIAIPVNRKGPDARIRNSDDAEHALLSGSSFACYFLILTAVGQKWGALTLVRRFARNPAALSRYSGMSRRARQPGDGIQRLELWVDGVKRYQILNDQMRHALTLTAGTHGITIVAVDQYAGYAKTTKYVSIP